MNGKLARIEEQEKIQAEKLRVILEAKESEKLANKKRKSDSPMVVQTVEPTPIIGHNEDDVENTLVIKTKKSKKSKRNKEVVDK